MSIIKGMFNRVCFDFRIMLISIKTIITAQTTSLQKLTADSIAYKRAIKKVKSITGLKYKDK